MSIRFKADDETLRPMGRATSGVFGMRFSRDDELLAMEVVATSDVEILVATEGGYAKRTKIEEYPLQGRGGKGVLTARIVSTRGGLVGAVAVRPEDEIYAITSDGVVIRTKAAEVRRAQRQTMGVRLMNLPEGVNLVADRPQRRRAGRAGVDVMSQRTERINARSAARASCPFISLPIFRVLHVRAQRCSQSARPRVGRRMSRPPHLGETFSPSDATRTNLAHPPPTARPHGSRVAATSTSTTPTRPGRRSAFGVAGSGPAGGFEPNPAMPPMPPPLRRTAGRPP